MHKIIRKLLLPVSVLSILLINNAQLFASPKGKKSSKKNNSANVKITALNYVDGKNLATAGAGFPVSINLIAADDYSALDGETVTVGFYLIKPENASAITKNNIATSSLYFGQVSLTAPKKGYNNYQERIVVKENLKDHSGLYYLYALVDPWDKLSENKSDNLYNSSFTVSISPDSYNVPSIEIAELKPDVRAIVLDKTTPQTVEGLVSLEAGFADYDFAEVSFCMVQNDNQCRELQVWDPGLKQYAASYKVISLLSGDEIASLFQVKIPEDLIDSLLPAITKPMGDTFTLRAKVTALPKIADAVPVTDYKDVSLNLLPPFEENPYLLTEYGQDVREIVLKTRREVKIARQTGFIKGKDKKSKKNNKNKKDDSELQAGIKSLNDSLNIITKELRAQADTITNTIGGSSAANLPGSRFNMPNLDFPWRRNLEVTVPPPPVRYSGNGFPTIADYKRCIPFFCGAMNEKDIGREPSEQCIRQYCGTTEQDLRYGGRNPVIFDLPSGFDYGFSHKGFGARIGLSGRVKIFKDQAIANYVGGSYDNSAFFGVTVFGYSVPIFEGFSQAVYSPTEISESYSQSVLKVLGAVVEREEKMSEALSETFSVTYGFKKGAEIGVGPFDVDVSAEAGGTLNLGFRIGAGVNGITGSVEPGASLGASARASAGISGASVGIEGAIELVRDTLVTALNLNVGLNIIRKVVTPQLNLTITNILTGPNGSIKVFVETFFETFRITLASFSTGEFRKTLYDKSSTFAEIRL